MRDDALAGPEQIPVFRALPAAFAIRYPSSVVGMYSFFFR
jgi:hypothetical protein